MMIPKWAHTHSQRKPSHSRVLRRCNHSPKRGEGSPRRSIHSPSGGVRGHSLLWSFLAWRPSPNGRASNLRSTAPRRTAQRGCLAGAPFYSLVRSELWSCIGYGPKAPPAWGAPLSGDTVCWPGVPLPFPATEAGGCVLVCTQAGCICVAATVHHQWCENKGTEELVATTLTALTLVGGQE